MKEQCNFIVDNKKEKAEEGPINNKQKIGKRKESCWKFVFLSYLNKYAN